MNGGYNYQIENSKFLVDGEIGINGLGSTKFGSLGTTSWYAVNFLGIATYNVMDNFYVWGETGPTIAWDNTTVNTTFSGSISTSSSSEMVWVLGAGAGYHWHQWNVFVRYDHYFGDSVNTNSNTNNFFPQVNAVFGGVAYTF